MSTILEINNLNISFDTADGEVQAVRGVNLKVKQGDFIALVGESGSGKTVTSESIMQLLAKNSKIKSGEILFDGIDLLKFSDDEMRGIRGNEISMIFQDPMTSLNPTMTIGKQISESLIFNTDLNEKQIKERVIEVLDLVGIPDPLNRINQYPHQFSGGMRQRVMIAIAIAASPRLIIADEPTTALDVTIQAQILNLLKDLSIKLKTTVLLITHDLGVVAETCDKVAVMYSGKIVETGSVKEIFISPKHPYTRGLLKSIPIIGKKEKLYSIKGTPPDLLYPPVGCGFVSRCEFAMELCKEEVPILTIGDRKVACWLQNEVVKNEILKNKQLVEVSKYYDEE